MHPFGELSTQRRRLGEALRAVRANAGLSGEQLAKQLGISQSRVSRIELGQQTASADLVRRWAEVTGAPEDRVAELVESAEAAGTEAVVWRNATCVVDGRSHRVTDHAFDVGRRPAPPAEIASPAGRPAAPRSQGNARCPSIRHRFATGILTAGK